MVSTQCPHCGKALELSDQMAGQEIHCPHCSQKLAVPGAQHTIKPDASAASPTRQLGVLGETPLPGTSPEPPDSLRFLAPPRAAGELGWLGKYRVLEVLGKGGMGIVFRAEDSYLKRQVALKVMKPELVTDAEAPQRFLREARATAAVKSDHIVTIHEVGQENGLPYLAMELLQGEPLQTWMQINRPIRASQLVDIAVQIARGLEAAHQGGLIHRDIKPANIWIELPSGRVKILDFGLARPLKDASLTQTGIVMGTPAYMAPEQADGAKVDSRSDLFSLGCVLYEVATEEPPFKGPNTLAVLKAVALVDPRPLHEVKPDLPAVLSETVMRMLAKKPEDRPGSAAEVVQSLQDLEGQPGGLKPLSGPVRRDARPPAPPPPRGRGLWLVGGAAMLAALVVGLFLTKDNWFPAGKHPRATAAGVTDNEIQLGMSAAFSGTSRELGEELRVGLDTYFDFLNEQGGIHGRKVRLVALDDGYEPDRALTNMQELVEKRKVFAVIGNVGTPTAEKTVPYALEKKMLFFSPFTGAAMLRKDPPDRYVFNVRASYEEETAASLKYLLEVKKIAPEQIAVFAQKDGYGDAGFRGVVKVMRKYGRGPEQILRVGHVRNSVDVKEAVTEIQKHAEIRAIIMVSTYRPASRFIQQVTDLKKDTKSDLIFVNVSFVGSNALAEELITQYGLEYAEGIIVTQVVPPIDSQSSLVSRFREHLQKFRPNRHPTFSALEGYIDAAVFAEAVKRTGDNLTTETLIDSLESIRDFDIGVGAPITFGPSEHQGMHKVWATVLHKDGKYKPLDLD